MVKIIVSRCVQQSHCCHCFNFISKHHGMFLIFTQGSTKLRIKFSERKLAISFGCILWQHCVILLEINLFDVMKHLKQFPSLHLRVWFIIVWFKIIWRKVGNAIVTGAFIPSVDRYQHWSYMHMCSFSPNQHADNWVIDILNYLRAASHNHTCNSDEEGYVPFASHFYQCDDWPLARYVALRVAHAPGMPGTFSPATAN